jgi:virulence factor
MLNYLIGKYKNIKRQSFLQQPLTYQNKYAIIGTGQHNTTNIYPCLWHLGVPVQLIYSPNIKNAENAAIRWPDCKSTNDLSVVLKDTDITAVIVCTEAKYHTGIVKILLENNKHVFVEKPIGYSREDLASVIAAQGENICQAGLQREFSPFTQLTKKLIANTYHYNYKFHTGAYPEGDAIYEVFIHPIAHITDLFGEGHVEHISAQKNGSGFYYAIILNHGPIKGIIELSTSHSWRRVTDEITINTSSRIINLNYPNKLSSIQKQADLFNIPLEKIWKQPLEEIIHLESSTFNPIDKLSSHYLHGFYPELEHFTALIEKKNKNSPGNLNKLIPVYNILDQMKQARSALS